MVGKIIENNNKQDLEYKLKKGEDSSANTNKRNAEENNKTLDKIVKEEQTKENYQSKRLSDYDRARIFDLYNSRKDIKVKDICRKFNENREKNGSKTKNFCVSTLYNILNKYEMQGRTVRWRRKKKNKKQNYVQLELFGKNETYGKNKKQTIGKIVEGSLGAIKNPEKKESENIADKPNCYKRTFRNYLTRTGNFFKKNIKKIVSYGLVGVLSFMIGFGASNYVHRKSNINYVPTTSRIEYIKENKDSEFIIEKGDSLWSLMDKETRRPDLWEIVYAANERPATTKIQKDRQYNLRKIGYKYDVECLKNVGQNGSLKPYEFKDQYKIRDNTKVNLSSEIMNDTSKLSPTVELEFNKVFYNSQ